MDITSEQIRAARAFLDWSREDLAKQTGLTAAGIKNIEGTPDIRPQRKTLKILHDTFLANGIQFTSDGVRRTDDTIRIIDGDDAYLKLLDDILYTTTESGEVLFLFADENVFYPAEQEMEERIRANGVRFRILVEEGNTNYRFPVREYRQIPRQYFNHSLQIVYGEKVAQVLANSKKIMIVHNQSFATTSRGIFNMLWSKLTPIKEEKL